MQWLFSATLYGRDGYPRGSDCHTQMRGGVGSDGARHGPNTYLLIVGAGEVVRDLKRIRETREDFRIEFTDVTGGCTIGGLAGAQSRKVPTTTIPCA